MDDVELQPWERQPGEPAHWYTRFRQYLEQEPPRFVLRVYRNWVGQVGTERYGRTVRRLDSLPNNWMKARDRHGWLDRADAYDRHIEAERIRKKEQARLAQENRELVTAHALYAKGDELLAFPTAVREEEAIGEDGTVQRITIIPAETGVFGEARKLYLAAMQKARLSLGMPTQIRHTIKEGGAEQNKILGVIILPDNGRGRPLEAIDITPETLPIATGKAHDNGATVLLPDRDSLPDDDDDADDGE